MSMHMETMHGRPAAGAEVAARYRAAAREDADTAAAGESKLRSSCTPEMLHVSEVELIFHCLYVRTGYRRVTGSFTDAFRSILTLHNETFNIWTHVIGTVLLLWWIAEVASNASEFSSCGDDIIICLYFLVSLLITHVTSVGFHVLLSMSATQYRRWLTVDNIGTMTGGLAIQVSGTWYGLREYPVGRAFALALYCTAFAAASVYFLTDYRRALYPSKQLIMAAFFNLWHLVFLALYLATGTWSRCTTAIYIWGWSGFWCFVLGLSIFNARFPERFAPGRFDIFFMSHQIWHTLAVLGSYFFFVNFKTYVQDTCPASC